MKCKSTILLLSFLLFSVMTSVFNVYAPPTPAEAAATKNSSMPQMPPGMTEEEMQMFTEFIDTLDQETIDALTAIGEEIIKEADELGIDPFQYIELQAKMQEEFEEDTEKAIQESLQDVGPKKTPTSFSAEALTAQSVFKGIAQIIPIIIQKASSDINLSNEILPFKYRLDDLVYYFSKLSEDKMLAYISDPLFAPLVENAKKLYTELVTLNDQFYVPEFDITGKNPYEVLDIPRTASQKDIVAAFDKISKITDPDMLELQLIREGKTDQQIIQEVNQATARFQKITDAYLNLRSKEEAFFILSRILDAITQTVDTNKIIEEAKKVLQKYEPEAEKLKKEREKLEEEARKTQDAFLKKRPIRSQSFAMPAPSRKYKPSTSRDKSDFGGGRYTPSSKKKDGKMTDKLIKAPGGDKKPGAKKPGDKKDDKKKEKEKRFC